MAEAWAAFLGAVAGCLRALAAALAGASSRAELMGRRAEASRRAAELSAVGKARVAGRWRSVFEAAPLPMAKVNAQGRLEVVNSALCALMGEPERALLGRRLSALVYPDDLAVLSGPGHPGRSARGSAKAEVRLVCAGGRLRWCELASNLVRDQQGRVDYVLVSFVDITRYKRSQAALRDLATRDPLSGLANRRWLELDLARHLRLCNDEGPRGAVLVVDLDNFKQVNDTFGHHAGDRLVLEVALTLRRNLRDGDLVARLGGDEFAVVLHDGDAGAAEAVARKLVGAVRDEVRVPAAPAAAQGASSSPRPAPGARGWAGAAPREPARQGSVPVTVSIGVAPIETLAAQARRAAGGAPGEGVAQEQLAAGASARSKANLPPGAAPGAPGPWGLPKGAGGLSLTGTPAAPGLSVASVLRAADEAMYLVKRKGRDGYAMAGRQRPEGPPFERCSSGPGWPGLTRERLGTPPGTGAGL